MGGVAILSRKPAVSLKRQDRTGLLLMTNGKLLSIGAKINYLGWPWTAISHFVSKYMHENLNKARPSGQPYYQRQRWL